jgi:hypothetical protein
MKVTTKTANETTVDFMPLLKHGGKWGAIAVVIIMLAWFASAYGMDFQFRLGPSSTSSPAVAP